MNFFSHLFTKKSEKYVLVISGGGVRWFYALWVLKAIEELWLKDKIEIVYGVSAGAIVGSYWAAGYSAQEIFDTMIGFKLMSWKMLNLLSKKSLLAHTLLKEKFSHELPKHFEDLKKKLFIGCVDTHKATFHLFKEGDLIHPLLGSMSIPGIFPPIEYKTHCLVDWGVLNNFPVDIAKREYPNHKIIGIYLNHFMEDQKIKNILDSLSLTYEILLRWPCIPKLSIPDYTLSRALNIKVLSADTKKMKKIFELGYADGLYTLWSIH